MLFPDQSPLVLIAVVGALLAAALFAAARDLLRERGSAMACPTCGLAFDPQRWARHNEHALYHGRNTVTPLYTCPRCGEKVHQASS